MRPEPKFKIGDEVIVVPHKKIYEPGEGVITSSRWCDNEPMAGDVRYTGHGYHVDGYNSTKEHVTPEYSLRKKHQPGAQSFQELMGYLKSSRPTIANLAEQLRNTK